MVKIDKTQEKLAWRREYAREKKDDPFATEWYIWPSRQQWKSMIKEAIKRTKIASSWEFGQTDSAPSRMLNTKNYSKRHTFHTKTCFLWQFCAFVKSVLRFFLTVTFFLRKRGRTSALRKSSEVLSSTGNSYSSRYWHLLTFSMALPYIASESRLFSVIDSC